MTRRALAKRLPTVSPLVELADEEKERKRLAELRERILEKTVIFDVPEMGELKGVVIGVEDNPPRFTVELVPSHNVVPIRPTAFRGRLN